MIGDEESSSKTCTDEEAKKSGTRRVFVDVESEDVGGVNQFTTPTSASSFTTFGFGSTRPPSRSVLTYLFDLECAFQRRLQTPWIIQRARMPALVLKVLLSEKTMFALPIVISWLIDPVIFIQLGVMLGFSAVINGWLKWFHQAPRPAWEYERTKIIQVEGGFEPDYSTPSFHAQASSVLATFLVYAYPYPASYVVFPLFTLISGLSRVFLGIHFVHDVIYGWSLGIGLALAFQYGDLAVRFFQLPKAEYQAAVFLIFFGVAYLGLFIVKTLVPEVTAEQKAHWAKQQTNKIEQAGSEMPPAIPKFTLRTYRFFTIPIWATIGAGLGLLLPLHVGKYPNWMTPGLGTPIRFLVGLSMYEIGFALLMKIPREDKSLKLVLARGILAFAMSFWASAVFAFAPVM